MIAASGVLVARTVTDLAEFLFARLTKENWAINFANSAHITAVTISFDEFDAGSLL